MRINRLSASRLQIILSREELQEMNLTYEGIDYQTPKTRVWLFSLLQSACAATDFSPRSRVFVEIYPDEQGGCIVYLSDVESSPARWRVRQRIHSPAIYAFDDVDLLITGAVKLFQRCSHRIRKSSLYRLGENWRLAIYPLDVLENITLSILDEYAPRCGEGELAASWLEEHANLIIRDNALDVLSSYFG